MRRKIITLTSLIAMAGLEIAGGRLAMAAPQASMGHDGADRCARLAERLARVDKKLTPDQVRDIVAGRIAQSGEGTLKVGKVSAKPDGVVTVEIVTAAGNSLVTSREISTKTGIAPDVVERCRQRDQRLKAAGLPGEPARQPEGRRPEGMRGERGFGPPAMGPMRGRERAMLETAWLVGPTGGRDLNLSSEQAKKIADASLVLLGNTRLKVGAAKEKDADTIAIDIVTLDNALVLRREVDRHTGRLRKPA